MVEFAVLADHKVILKKIEKRGKLLDLGKELKKLWSMKVTMIPIVIGVVGRVTKGLVQELGDLEMRTSGDHPNYSFVEIYQNTEKCPEDLRRLAVT